MSVGSGGTRRSIFVRSEELVQFIGGPFPFPRRMWLKDICHRAPPAVARKDSLLEVGGVPVIGFKVFESADSFEVGEGLFPQATLADSMCRGYSEIAGGRAWLRVSVAGKDNRRRFGLGSSAHSRIAISHAAW